MHMITSHLHTDKAGTVWSSHADVD